MNIDNEQLRRECDRIIREGDQNTLTNKIIRRELEQALGLKTKTFDSDEWKSTTNAIIEDVFLKINEKAISTSAPPPLSQTQTKTKKKIIRRLSDEVTKDEVAVTTHKNSSATSLRNNDDGKTVTEAQLNGIEENHHSGAKKRKLDKKHVIVDEPLEDSEMSDVEDEEPKKGKNKSESTKAKESSKNIKDLTQQKDEETIKRLKNYIVKCGVRKNWSKEFSGLDTTKAQIKKLRQILTDLGVEGQPSIQKCEKIKAARELQEELNSLDTTLVMEGSKRQRSGSEINKYDTRESKGGGLDVSFLNQSSDSDDE